MTQSHDVFGISFRVPSQFTLPEISIGLGQRTFRAFVLVKKTSIYEDYPLCLTKHYVRLAGKGINV
jgi:hypothetical protein